MDQTIAIHSCQRPTSYSYSYLYQLFVKTSLQLVISVAALFSIFLCCYSWFPHSFNVYFSTFLFSLFTHTLERKYMFLICNGILAILAKTSLSSKSLVSDYQDEMKMKPLIAEDQPELIAMEGFGPLIDDNKKIIPEDDEGSSEESVIVEAGGGEDSVEEEFAVVEDMDGQGKSEPPKAAANEDEPSTEELNRKIEEPPKEAAAAANEDEPSTEELNRKIEEFIRKMKEEIRIEAQQLPIAAV